MSFHAKHTFIQKVNSTRSKSTHFNRITFRGVYDLKLLTRAKKWCMKLLIKIFDLNQGTLKVWVTFKPSQAQSLILQFKFQACQAKLRLDEPLIPSHRCEKCFKMRFRDKMFSPHSSVQISECCSAFKWDLSTNCWSFLGTWSHFGTDKLSLKMSVYLYQITHKLNLSTFAGQI